MVALAKGATMSRVLAIAVVASVFAVGAAPIPAAADATGTYSLNAFALLGNEGTDVYLTISSAEGLPDRLEKVQLKALPFEGDHLRTSNYLDLPAPGGNAVLHVAGLVRHRPLQLLAQVKDGPQHNMEAQTRVLLRPDLTVTGISVPADVVRRHSFKLTAAVAEVAGDTGASATATLFDGSMRLGSKVVAVEGGGSATVVFDALLEEAGRHDLRVELSGSSPAQSNIANDDAVVAVDAHMYTSKGVVSTDHWIATEVGENILRAGGNAVDAAAAVQFALNVVNPNLTGIGGGSAVLVRLANGDEYAIDGRERAPHATTPDTYRGKRVADIGINGFSVGVPATLRTVDEMLERWGTMSLKRVLEEPIRLAETGVPVGSWLAAASAEARTLNLQPETIATFRRPDQTPLRIGDTLFQPDLAKTFRLIADQGADVFYTGEIAQAIIDAQRRLSPTFPLADGQGLMTLADLAQLRVTIEKPLSLDFRGHHVLAPPPSTNGGVVLLEALGLYDRVELANPEASFAFGTFASMHTSLEALRLALADRDMWVGDDDVVDLPIRGLISDGYLTARSNLIQLDGRIVTALPGDPRPYNATAIATTDDEPTGHTSHMSIIDQWGNAVSMTATVADSFGSGIMVPGYGFLLNDSLTLFNQTPRRDPASGNPGANDAAPNKRPMGSMTPAMVVKDGEPFFLTGTYGGAFIPSLVFNVVSNVIAHETTFQQAVDAPRMWASVPNVNPPSANFARNPGHPQETIDAMRAIGDQIARVPTPGFGSASSAGVDLATVDLIGASDRRQWQEPFSTVVPRP
jgi:gamma-glutamyltranspeptidase/glutathione hydrolase